MASWSLLAHVVFGFGARVAPAKEILQHPTDIAAYVPVSLRLVIKEKGLAVSRSSSDR